MTYTVISSSLSHYPTFIPHPTPFPYPLTPSLPLLYPLTPNFLSLLLLPSDSLSPPLLCPLTPDSLPVFSYPLAPSLLPALPINS